MFVPKWAEHELQNHVHAQAEIALHREFFEAWEALHDTPNDKVHRKMAEERAQRLVDLAHSIKRLREPAEVVKTILNGGKRLNG